MSRTCAKPCIFSPCDVFAMHHDIDGGETCCLTTHGSPAKDGLETSPQYLLPFRVRTAPPGCASPCLLRDLNPGNAFAWEGRALKLIAFREHDMLRPWLAS